MQWFIEYSYNEEGFPREESHVVCYFGGIDAIYWIVPGTLKGIS